MVFVVSLFLNSLAALRMAFLDSALALFFFAFRLGPEFATLIPAMPQADLHSGLELTKFPTTLAKTCEEERHIYV